MITKRISPFWYFCMSRIDFHCEQCILLLRAVVEATTEMSETLSIGIVPYFNWCREENIFSSVDPVHLSIPAARSSGHNVQVYVGMFFFMLSSCAWAWCLSICIYTHLLLLLLFVFCLLCALTPAPIDVPCST